MTALEAAPPVMEKSPPSGKRVQDGNNEAGIELTDEQLKRLMNPEDEKEAKAPQLVHYPCGDN